MSLKNVYNQSVNPTATQGDDSGEYKEFLMKTFMDEFIESSAVFIYGCAHTYFRLNDLGDINPDEFTKHFNEISNIKEDEFKKLLNSNQDNNYLKFFNWYLYSNNT